MSNQVENLQVRGALLENLDGAVRQELNAMKYGYHLALLLGIGAACHVIFHGDAFDYASLKSWAYLLGWPAMLLYHAWYYIVAICAVIAVIVLAMLAIMGLAVFFGDLRESLRERRVMNQQREQIRLAMELRRLEEGQ